MVHEPIYLDLSSSSEDDDEDHDRDRNVPRGSTTLLYLAKVFHMDDDDVRIIDKPTSNGKVRRGKTRVVRTPPDDDDCCILDVDPGADAAPDVVSSLNTDELVMTGEKGPVACRDFPHARYLCVHFPFKSTLHANFCAQCHCYVCDSLAPCSLWGEGNSPNDHCHASEEPRWKSLRKVAKYGSVVSLSTTPTTGAADPMGGSRLIQTTLLQSLPLHVPVIAPSPVDPLGVVPRVATTVKSDPLILHLKGHGRGKDSQQHPPHLGVRNGRQLGVRHRTSSRKSAPACLVSSLPRPTSPPLGAAPPSTAQPPSQTATPNPSFRLGRAEGGVRPTRVSRSALATNRAGGGSSPPHPCPTQSWNNTPPGRGVAMTQPSAQLPQPTLVHPHPNTPPPPPVTNDALPVPSAEAPTVAAAPLISDTRYVSASATLRDQHVSDVSTSSSQPHRPSVAVTGCDFVAQDSGTPTPSASSSHGWCNRGTVDILAGPIEGWEMDADATGGAVLFDSFAVAGGSPEHVATSLNDVIAQMAADDYLWEPYPGWQ